MVLFPSCICDNGQMCGLISIMCVTMDRCIVLFPSCVCVTMDRCMVLFRHVCVTADRCVVLFPSCVCMYV